MKPDTRNTRTPPDQFGELGRDPHGEAVGVAVVNEPIRLTRANINIAGLHTVVRAELHNQMWIEAVAVIAANVSAIRREQLPHLIVQRDQMQCRAVTKFAHGDGGAHGRATQCDPLVKSEPQSAR